MQKKLNLSVIGCGYWGPNLIRNFNALPECHLRKVSDLSQDRLNYIKQLYPEIEPTNRVDHIFNDPDIDAVVIATPVSTHFNLAKKSLQSQKHTFIEKPMTASVEESRELVRLADQMGCKLMVGHTYIYSPPVRRIKEIIDSGEIGDIMYISSRRLNLGLFQKDINVAWDLSPHDISIILYLMGEPPKSLNCQGKAHMCPGIEDVTNMSINFSNGGFATVHNSWLDPNKVREMKIVGSKKMIVYDDTEQLEKIKIYDKHVDIPPYYDTFAEFQYSYHYGDMHCPYLKQEEPLKVECQHFLDCIKSGEEPESSGVDGLRVVQILDASSRSLKNGGSEVAIDDLAVEAPFLAAGAKA